MHIVTAEDTAQAPADLTIEVYTSPGRPFMSAITPEGPGDEPTWSPSSATLIYGDHDAILVDTLATYDQADALADWIETKGRRLSRIYITHGHGDHWLGLARLIQRFPGAQGLETIKKLLQFKGQGIAEGEAVNLTTGGYLLGHMKRAADILPACAAAVPGNVKNLLWFKQELDDKAIKQEEDPANKNKTLDQKPTVKAAVTAAAEALKGDWGPLVETIKANPDSRELNTLHELLLNIKTAGSDTSKGQRFIYGAHAYSIIDVVFKRTNGTPFVPRIDHLDTDLNQVSANLSTVTLRNPHHGNEPNPTGAAEAGEGPDRGKFTISLAQYFRNFTELDYGRVKATT